MTSPSPQIPAGFLRVGTLDEMRRRGCLTVRAADRPVVVFDDGGTPRAVDNRCPHLGFPLSRGSLKDGIITCPWHNARFDAASGCTFDLWADDVPPFDLVVRNGEIWIGPYPRTGGTPASALRRLREGMEQNISLISAKAILTLQKSGEPMPRLVLEAALFGTSARENWSGGMTILTALANLLPGLSEKTAYLALLQGVRHVAEESQGSPARRGLRPLEGCDAPLPRLRHWLEYWVLVRHRDAAERTLLTAVAQGATPRDLAELVFTAATIRFFADGGHALDFCNKAFELLDLVGWELAPEVLPTIAGHLVLARGGEESNAWRHPEDLVPLVGRGEEHLPRALDEGRTRRWSEEAVLANLLLGDDPQAIVDGILDAARSGARPPQLAKALCYAAALRIARFGPSNELSDWMGALHTFTYCNAVHQALKRLHAAEQQADEPVSGSCPSGALQEHAGDAGDAYKARRVAAPSRTVVRGVLHGAMAVYLDRFLNVPPAPLPGERSPSTPLSEFTEDPLGQLLTLFDSRHSGDKPARLVASWLDAGRPVEPLIETLTLAVVREDADFHTYQMLEAAVRQYAEWDGGAEGRNIFVALARYIAAHSPTQRAAHQTALTALRLHRGDSLHTEG